MELTPQNSTPGAFILDRRFILGIISLLSIAILGVLFFSYSTSKNMLDEHLPQLEAGHEARNYIALVHINTLEALSAPELGAAYFHVDDEDADEPPEAEAGDADDDETAAWTQDDLTAIIGETFESAEWYLTAMLEGGDSPYDGDSIAASDDETTRVLVKSARGLMVTYRNAFTDMWATFEETGTIDPEQRVAFEQAFDRFTEQMEVVESRQEEVIGGLQGVFQLTNLGAAVISQVLVAGAGFIFLMMDRARSNHIDVLEASQQQTNMFRALVENASDAIALGDASGRITYINGAFSKLHRMDGETLHGRSLQHFVDVGLSRSDTDQIRRRSDGTTFPAVENRFHIFNDARIITATASIIRDVTEERAAEAERLRQQQESAAEQERLQAGIIEAQQQALRELETPVIPLVDGIIVIPLIGTIDSRRAREITRSVLHGITRHNAQIVLLDITGVALVDTAVADHLNKTIQAARLKGAHTILSGMSDSVAETVVDLGIDWDHIEARSDLQSGLMAAFEMQRLRLVG